MPRNESLDALLFGADATPGLVAVEPLADGKADRMALFLRAGDDLRREEAPFEPFLWIRNADLLADIEGPVRTEPLDGNNPLRALAFFRTWKDLDKTVRALKKMTGHSPTDPDAPFFLINDPVQQFLMLTGRTLFKGMRFAHLRRFQVDIETYTTPGFEFSNPEREGDRIIAIAMADASGWSEVLQGTDLDEAEMLREFVRRLRERDPDAIEGHNLFRFDLAYLAARARRHRVKLAIGRDGSEPACSSGRYVAAERTVAYPKFQVFGRHVVDTYFLSLAYDATHRSLESHGLKDVARHFGVAAENRTYIEGDEIARTFERDPRSVFRYAHDDILETRSVASILEPSYMVQAQILPLAFQNVCVRGTGARIDALLLREYLRRRRAIPRPDDPRAFEGGYTDVFFTGVARNVHHCDVRSLYPSIMLRDRIAPRSDDLGVFLDLLSYLRDLRVEAKTRMRRETDPAARADADATQTTLKLLINSFYGYLGFRQARFSDFAAAERVAAEGRSLLERMLALLRERGAKPIEIDTDGIYFVPPPLDGDAALNAFRESVQDALPEGIDLEFDGEYRAMFSYKMKNYALLDAAGELTIKGAALKSRGIELFQRRYIEDWLRLKLERRDAEIPALARRTAQAIERREWPIRMLAKTETLQDSPATYRAKIDGKGRGRNAAYELALKSEREYRAGDQVSHYVTGSRKSVAVHEAAKLVTDWDPSARDENVPYYLAKLDALVRKFGTDEDARQPTLGLEENAPEE